MTEQTITILTTGAFTLIGGMFAAHMNFKLAQLQTQAAATAKVVDATHKLSNANMGIQLRLYKVSTRRNFDLSGKPEDLAIAEDAERAYKNHESQQDKVDADNPFGLPPAEQKGGKS